MSLSATEAESALSLFIPSSFLVESRDARIRTYKVGQIARAASVFRATEIVVYRHGVDDSKFIDLVLRYAETPQYLRKKIFPLREELRYVGVIPPLRTPHHPTAKHSSEIEIGEIREGVVTEVGSDDRAWVDIGLEDPARLCKASGLHDGERVTVRIFSRRPLKAELASPREYWGYRTRIAGGLVEALGAQMGGSDYDCVIATSRKGRVLDLEYLQELAPMMRGRVAVVFGSPDAGVGEILGDEGRSLEEITQHVVNAVPRQGTATIRTEEAVYITLALLNLIR